MKSLTSRQRSLSLAAKLYELAAEFTDEELLSMLHEYYSDSKNDAIRAAIQALIGLHRVSESSLNEARQHQARDRTEMNESRSRVTRASALIDLFSDRSMFPTVAQIAEVSSLPPKPKEARERYLSRVARAVNAMDGETRDQYFELLQSKVRHRPNSFISRWSKVIKES